MRVITKNISRSIINKKKTIILLKPTTIEVENGELIGLIGENGCGKTTLLRLISRIDTPSEGTLRVNGKITPVLNKNTALIPHLNAYDALYYIGALYGLKHNEIKSRFGQIMRFAELESMEKEPLYAYSEGMKSRLIISLALHTYPEILLLDEMLGNVDQPFQEKLFEYLKRFTKEGKSAIIVEHNIELLNKYCDRIITLKR